MRADFIRMTSSTGGASTLTCTAQTGYPIVSKAFTGTRLVDYEINEYTDSTKATLSKAETGVGSYNTSTEVLTRSKVLSTWDGTTYLPNPGSATAPTALTFGSTAANIDIMIGPMAGGIIPPLPFQMGAVASVSDGLGSLPLNVNLLTTGTMTPTSGTVYYFPALIMHQGPFSQFTVRQVTATTGGSPTVDFSIYEVGTDGFAGKKLIGFTQKAVGAANTTYTSAALATPVYLVPGWYWMAFMFLVGGGSGGTFRTVSNSGGCWGPTLLANGTSAQAVATRASQSALNDPATAATGNLNSTTVPAVFVK